MAPSDRKRKRRQRSDDEDEESRVTQWEDGDDLDAPRIAQWVDEDEVLAGELPPEHVGTQDDTEVFEDELRTLPLGMLRKAHHLITQAEVATEDSESEASDDESDAHSSTLRGEPSTSANQGGEERKLKHPKRTNKHAPMEVTSKKPVSRKRTVVDTKQVQPRDPRFLSISGEFDPKKFQQQYQFLAEKHQNELVSLRDHLKRARRMLSSTPREARAEHEKEVERLELAVRRAESLVNRDRSLKIEQEALSTVKKDEREKRKEGKGAWYLKDADKKKLVLKARFDALAAEGGHRAVKKAITKREKKIGQKEKKRRPNGQQYRGSDTGERQSKRMRT